jgi:FdhD protein
MTPAPPDGTGRRDLLLYDGKALARCEETLIDEVPLEVWLNDTRLMTIACAGLHVEELAVGFLRSEGLLKTREELVRVVVAKDGRQVRVCTRGGRETKAADTSGRTLASSGARGIGAVEPVSLPSPALADTVRVTPEAVFSLLARFLEQADLHARTGGTHAAALVRGGEILVVREDIGRHNTIDMLGGYALLHAMDCRDAFIIRTGRVSAEIVQKVRRLGVPLVVSLSVPTTLAVEMAQLAGVTLIGSVRGGRMKIYSHEGRVHI